MLLPRVIANGTQTIKDEQIYPSWFLITQNGARYYRATYKFETYKAVHWYGTIYYQKTSSGGLDSLTADEFDRYAQQTQE